MAEKIKIYEYNRCSTCRKAIKFLEERDIEFTVIPIREKPPTKADLKKMLKFLDNDKKLLFNRSGKDYREMGLKDKINDMTVAEAIDLLNSNGNLVKRPFLLAESWGVVGFKEDIWEEKLN